MEFHPISQYDKPLVKGIFNRTLSGTALNRMIIGTPSTFRRRASQIELTSPTKMDERLASSLPDLVNSKPMKSCLSNSSLSMLGGQDRKNRGMKRNVSFDKLEIREHPRILGDHPRTRTGPSLALDWYIEGECSDESKDSFDDANIALKCRTIEMSLDDYENMRVPRKARPVPKAKREKLLRDFGVSNEEMLLAKVEVEEEQKKTVDKEQVKLLIVLSKVADRVMNGGATSTEVELDQLMRRAARADYTRNDRLAI
jgi:hypothetical protein